MRFPFASSARLIIALVAIAVTSAAQAENLPATHPTVELVKKYFQYVVEQNWKDAATMIRPSSIERKKKETLAIIKSASTMSEEAAMLAKLGVKDLRELEKMSVEEFYVADRQSFHNLARNNEEILKQKKASLKVDVLGVVGEQNGTVAHLAVRTSQEVMDQRINELFFISFTQDETDKTKWQIAPDMQRPVTEPVNKAGAAAPAAATEKKAE